MLSFILVSVVTTLTVCYSTIGLQLDPHDKVIQKEAKALGKLFEDEWPGKMIMSSKDDELDTSASEKLHEVDKSDVTSMETKAPSYDVDSENNETVDYDYSDYPVHTPQPMLPRTKPSEALNMTKVHAEAKLVRIKQIREEILSKLRLDVPPNITFYKDKIGTYPHHMLPDLSENVEGLQMDSPRASVDNYHAKIETIVQFSSSFPKSKSMKETSYSVYFDIPLDVSKRNLNKATMLVYLNTAKVTREKTVMLIVSSTLRESKPLLERRVEISRGDHWEHIDITSEVREWVSDDEKNNFGLIVKAMVGDENIAFVSPDIHKDFGKKPLVKLELNTNEATRYRRSFEDVPLACEVSDDEQRCCRYMFVVDFDELGKDFDFVITPRRYQANYCAGACPTYHLPPTNTHSLLSGYNRRKIQRCCTPTEMEPLTILYLTDGGAIKQGILPKMSIEKCACS